MVWDMCGVLQTNNTRTSWDAVWMAPEEIAKEGIMVSPHLLDDHYTVTLEVTDHLFLFLVAKQALSRQQNCLNTHFAWIASPDTTAAFAFVVLENFWAVNAQGWGPRYPRALQSHSTD